MSMLVWIFAGIIGIDHFKVSPAAGVMGSLKCLWLASALVQLPLAAVKISILLFYKRIFSTQKFGIAVWVAIFLVSCWSIIFFFLVLFQSDPFDGSWTGKGRLRFDSAKLGLAQVGTSIALDFVVLCFPLPIISRLHLVTKKKVAIGMIFWLGSFCCVAAIVRLVLLNQSIHQVIDSQGFSQVFVQSKNFVFMIVEPNCSIIAACLPCYGPLFRGGRKPESLVRSIRSLFSLRSQSSTSSNSNYFKFGEANITPQNVSATESQIELKNGARSTANGERLSYQTDEQQGDGRKGGVNVTRGVEVIRD